MGSFARAWSALLVVIALVACGMAPRDAVDAPPEDETGSAAGEVIPGSYVVMLTDGAAERSVAEFEGALSALLTSADGWTLAADADVVPLHVIGGFAVRGISEETAAALGNDPRVAAIEPDRIVTLAAAQYGPSWGLDRIDQRSVTPSNHYRYEYTGAGVHVYVIDSGIRSTQQDFGGRVKRGFTAIADGRGTEDCMGHGTHVAGTIGGREWGVAKGVTLVPVRVFDCRGDGPLSGLLAGIDWVRANLALPAVVNMSLGGAPSSAIDAAVRNLHAAKVTVVVAAGNESVDACTTSPAREPVAITVGATTSRDRRAEFSNFGPCVDVFAPGLGIPSAVSSSDSGWMFMDGTSTAAPHVAGAAALQLHANPTASPTTIARAITSAATLIPTNARDRTGSPHRILYVDPSFGLPCQECGWLRAGVATQGTSFTTEPMKVPAGSMRANLIGPVGANDFDLHLERLANGVWTRVTSSATVGSREAITRTVSAGTYRWRVFARRGSGMATLYHRIVLTGSVASGAAFTSGVIAVSPATHQGRLTGAAGTEFDLVLERFDGRVWVPVTSSARAGSTESVTFAGGSDSFRWRIVSRFATTGTFTLTHWWDWNWWD